MDPRVDVDELSSCANAGTQVLTSQFIDWRLVQSAATVLPVWRNWLVFRATHIRSLRRLPLPSSPTGVTTVAGPGFGVPGTSLYSQGVIVSTHSISPLRVLLLYTSSGTYFET